MHLTRYTIALASLLASLLAFAGRLPGATEPNPDPILNAATEQSRLDRTLPDGGLPPVVGVQNIEVFRASRDLPALTDGKGWTYNHHVAIPRLDQRRKRRRRLARP